MTAPASPDSPHPAETLEKPFKAIIVTVGTALAIAAVLNLVTGKTATAVTCFAACLIAALAWRLQAAGRHALAATLVFYSLAVTITLLLWVGHGTRDYSLAIFPSVLFLGCVFLGAAAYWGLAVAVLAGVTALGVAELTGVLPSTATPPELRNLVNLWLVIGATAVGGRVLMQAVRGSVARERSLSGALQDSEDRMRKIFQSSQNAIVVVTLAEGRYLDVNDAYLAMFGYQRSQVIGQTSLALGIWEAPRERERFVSEVREARAVREFETRLRRQSGELIEVQLSAEVIDIGGVECLVISTADISARRSAERRAEFLATRDALTGLPNRGLALDRLQRALERPHVSGEVVAVLHVDLDRFKVINEAVGRVHGDVVLREAGARITALLQGDDTLARIGGDEFVLIAQRPAGRAAVERLAAAVVAVFETPFGVDGRSVRVSTSVGVSLSPDNSADAETLLLFADTAAHVAKGEGRGRYCLYDQVMGRRVRDRLFFESSLRESIASASLSLVYQPKFDLRDGSLTGVEALARWTHPVLGSVPPAHFIAVAEESELICELGSWALREACAQVSRWRAAGLQAPPIAVNLSARQLTPDLPKLLSDCTRSAGVPPGMLELEVTETMLIARPERSRKVLEEITSNGNSIMLDDFGVGYSSLSYVKLLHLAGIKIDRSFVSDVAASRHDKAIVSAIVGLAHGLGFRVVAEGVETEAQLNALRDLGCDEAQGFHLSRPLSGEQIATEVLRKARTTET